MKPEYGPPINDKEWVHIPAKGMFISCCSCGLVHDVYLKNKDGKLYLRLIREDRRTAQLRKGKSPELLNGEDPRWQMIRKK